jgi:hypothetical protein
VKCSVFDRKHSVHDLVPLSDVSRQLNDLLLVLKLTIQVR